MTEANEKLEGALKLKEKSEAKYKKYFLISVGVNLLLLMILFN